MDIEPYPDDDSNCDLHSVFSFGSDDDIEPFPDSDDDSNSDHDLHSVVSFGSDDTNVTKFHEVRQRLSPCPDKCAWRLSREDFNEIIKNKPESKKQHTQWLLDYFFQHATQDTVCHLICGKDVCENCWKEVHQVSSYKYNKYLKESRMGIRQKIHGNTGSVKPSIKNTESIDWFYNFVADIGEHMPHQEKINLPAGMKKTEVWKQMVSDMGSTQCLSRSSFLQKWNSSFTNVAVVKENPFSKCHICTTLHFEYEKCGRYDKEAKALIIEKKKQHWDYVRKQKEAYYERRECSRLQPQKYFTVIMDGMDQKKTNVPILYSKARNSKQICNLQQIRTHLLGTLVHREGSSGEKKIGFGHFDLMQYPHDSNLNLTVLLDTITAFRDGLGRELHLQTDSASDNKNKVVLGFLGILVHLGIFEECFLHMLPVGHTHEDIDAMFSNYSSLLKRDIMTLEALIYHFKQISYVREGRFVTRVWDFKKWLQSHLINNHGLGEQFEFYVHTQDKESRTPIFHYRKGEGERWLPDSSDPGTFERKEDQHGIQIFKDLEFLKTSTPDIVLPRENGTYLDKVIKETGPKLLASGLLKEEERKWWESFPALARGKFLEPTSDVYFSLLNLGCRLDSTAHIASPLPIEKTLRELVDKADKRTLVYTGNYIQPKRRKRDERNKNL